MGESKGKRQIQPVISSLSVLHCPEHTKRFTELGREEKGDGGDRRNLVEKKESQKVERANKPVINSLCSVHSLDPSEMFTGLHREEKWDRGGQEEKRGNQKERDRSSQ